MGGSAVKEARLLTQLLADPARAGDVADWTALICVARAESLIGSLAHRLADESLPAPVAAILEDARSDFAEVRRQALWEAEMARRALAATGAPVILLKGSA